MLLWCLAVGVPGTFLIALFVGRTLSEAVQIACMAGPMAVPLLALWWVHPALNTAHLTLRRFSFAVLWAVATFIPALFFGVVIAAIVTRLAGLA